MTSDGKLLALIERIYELGLETDQWPQMLDEIAAHFGCNRASYTYFASGDASRSHEFFRHPEPSSPAVIDARAIFREMPPYSDIWLRSFVNGRHFGEQVLRGHTIIDREEFLSSDWFHQVIKPLDTFDILTVPFSYADGAWGFCNVFANKRRGVFSQKDEARYSVLRPHIARVIGLQRQFSHRLRLGALASSTLDALSFSLLLVGANGKIAFANERAQRLLKSRDGVSERGGALTTADPEAYSRLKHMLERACGIGGKPTGGSLPIRCDRARPLALHIYPFEVRDRPVSLSPFSPERVALIIVSDPMDRAPTNEAIWTALYGLTATETKIAGLLLDGHRQRDIASRLQITENTMRWHVKSMLRKTETSREAEMVMRLTRALPPIAAG